MISIISPQTNVQEDGFLELMQADGSLKSDVKVPEGDLGDEIKKAFDDGKEVSVTVIAAMGEEAVSFLNLIASFDRPITSTLQVIAHKASAE